MPIGALIELLLPVSLAIIMLGLGLGLTLDDFRRVALAPRALLLGMLGQMVVLPLLALGLALATGAGPYLAAGLVLLALCPGGVTSNVFSHLARGDVALSVSLTAVISVVAPFSIPLLGNVFLDALGVEAQSIRLDVPRTLKTLLLLTLVPVLAGMGLRALLPRLAVAAERFVSPAAVVLMLAIILAIVVGNRDVMPGFIAQTGLYAVVLNLLAIGAGVGIALVGRLGHARAATLGIEVGVQNATLTLLITGVLLQSPEMSILPAVYGLLMFPVTGLFVFLVRRTGWTTGRTHGPH